MSEFQEGTGIPSLSLEQQNVWSQAHELTRPLAINAHEVVGNRQRWSTEQERSDESVFRAIDRIKTLASEPNNFSKEYDPFYYVEMVKVKIEDPLRTRWQGVKDEIKVKPNDPELEETEEKIKVINNEESSDTQPKREAVVSARNFFEENEEKANHLSKLIEEPDSLAFSLAGEAEGINESFRRFLSQHSDLAKEPALIRMRGVLYDLEGALEQWKLETRSRGKDFVEKQGDLCRPSRIRLDDFISCLNHLERNSK